MGKYDDAIGGSEVILSVKEVLDEQAATKVDQRIKKQKKELEESLKPKIDVGDAEKKLKTLQARVEEFENARSSNKQQLSGLSVDKDLEQIGRVIEQDKRLERQVDDARTEIDNIRKQLRERKNELKTGRNGSRKLSDEEKSIDRLLSATAAKRPVKQPVVDTSTVADTKKQVKANEELADSYKEVEKAKKSVEKSDLLKSVEALEDNEEIADAKTIAQKREAAARIVKGQYAFLQEMKEIYDSGGEPSKNGNLYDVSYDDILAQQSRMEVYIALYEKLGGNVEKLGKRIKQFSDDNGFTGSYQYNVNEYEAQVKAAEEAVLANEKLATSQQKIQEEYLKSRKVYQVTSSTLQDKSPILYSTRENAEAAAKSSRELAGSDAQVIEKTYGELGEKARAAFDKVYYSSPTNQDLAGQKFVLSSQDMDTYLAMIEGRSDFKNQYKRLSELRTKGAGAAKIQLNYSLIDALSYILDEDEMATEQEVDLVERILQRRRSNEDLLKKYVNSPEVESAPVTTGLEKQIEKNDEFIASQEKVQAKNEETKESYKSLGDIINESAAKVLGDLDSTGFGLSDDIGETEEALRRVEAKIAEIKDEAIAAGKEFNTINDTIKSYTGSNLGKKSDFQDAIKAQWKNGNKAAAAKLFEQYQLKFPDGKFNPEKVFGAEWTDNFSANLEQANRDLAYFNTQLINAAEAYGKFVALQRLDGKRDENSSFISRKDLIEGHLEALRKAKQEEEDLAAESAHLTSEAKERFATNDPATAQENLNQAINEYNSKQEKANALLQEFRRLQDLDDYEQEPWFNENESPIKHIMEVSKQYSEAQQEVDDFKVSLKEAVKVYRELGGDMDLPFEGDLLKEIDSPIKAISNDTDKLVEKNKELADSYEKVGEAAEKSIPDILSEGMSARIGRANALSKAGIEVNRNTLLANGEDMFEQILNGTSHSEAVQSTIWQKIVKQLTSVGMKRSEEFDDLLKQIFDNSAWDNKVASSHWYHFGTKDTSFSEDVIKKAYASIPNLANMSTEFINSILSELFNRGFKGQFKFPNHISGFYSSDQFVGHAADDNSFLILVDIFKRLEKQGLLSNVQTGVDSNKKGKATSFSTILEDIYGAAPGEVFSVEEIKTIIKRAIADNSGKFGKELFKPIINDIISARTTDVSESTQWIDNIKARVEALGDEFKNSQQCKDFFAAIESGSIKAEDAVNELDKAFLKFNDEASFNKLTEGIEDEVVSSIPKGLSSGQLLQAFGSVDLGTYFKSLNINDEETIQKLKDSYTQLLQLTQAFENGMNVDDKFNATWNEIIDTIVKFGSVTQDTSDIYKEFLQYMKGKKITWNEGQKAEFRDDWSSVRQRYQKYLVSLKSGKGIGIDQIWDELQKFGLFTEMDGTNEKSMLYALVRELDRATAKSGIAPQREEVEYELSQQWGKMMYAATKKSAEVLEGEAVAAEDVDQKMTGAAKAKGKFNDANKKVNKGADDSTDSVEGEAAAADVLTAKVEDLGGAYDSLAATRIGDSEDPSSIIGRKTDNIDGLKTTTVDRFVANEEGQWEKASSTVTKSIQEFRKKYNSELNKFSKANAQIELAGGKNILDENLKVKFNSYGSYVKDLARLTKKLRNNPALADDTGWVSRFNQTAAAAQNAGSVVNNVIKQWQKSGNFGEQFNVLNDVDTRDVDNLKISMIQFAQAVTQGQFELKGFSDDGKTMFGVIRNGGKTISDVTISLKEGTNQLVAYKKASTSVTGVWGQLKNSAAGGLAKLAGMYLGFNDIIRYAREGYEAVKEIDLAMTELKKVTDETDATYKKFLGTASQTSKTIGATLQDFTTVTSDFARLGYSLEESTDLAKAALIYENVGDGFSSVSEASESIISTMKAFKVEATDTMGIVDKFNEVKITCLLVW